MGRVEKLVIGRDGYCRGAKILTTTKNGHRTSCTRPLQRLVPLIYVNSETQPSSETKESCALSESVSENNMRSKRRAAEQGQTLRRLREKFG